MVLMQKLVLAWLRYATPRVAAQSFDDVITRTSITLLEPLGNDTSIAIGPGVATFLSYFNSSVNWLFQVAVGFTVVWVLIAGFQFMTSGNNQSARTEAIGRMTAAIGGLLVLLLAGFILRLLNNIFFVV